MRSNKIVTSGNFTPGLSAQNTQHYIIQKKDMNKEKINKLMEIIEDILYH